VQPGLDITLDPNRLAEALAAVDDPMPYGVGFPEVGSQSLAQLAGVDLCARRVELAGSERLVLRVEQRQLQAAGARVDDQDSR
jgi:hypothetical protein